MKQAQLVEEIVLFFIFDGDLLISLFFFFTFLLFFIF